MSETSASNLLTKEELSFIRELFKDSHAPVLQVLQSLAFADREENRLLVTTLKGTSNLELKADLGDHRFVFPFHMVSGPEGETHLELAIPHILELAKRVRDWRFAPLEQEICLADYEEHFTDPKVLNISKSGICIRDQAPKGDVSSLELTLQFPKQSRSIRVHCDRVRETQCADTSDCRQIAFQYEDASPEAVGAINRYLFEQHFHTQEHRAASA